MKLLKKFDLKSLEPGTIVKTRFHIIDDGMGTPMGLPVFVAKGKKPGPVVGLTAAVHGNELNGVKVIHKLISELEAEIDNLAGTVVAVPVVNIYGVLTGSRYFLNGEDLNRIMPGKAKGNSSSKYVYRFVKNIVRKFDYLVDLHTASFGRANSYYVRVDLEDEKSAAMAHLLHPQIIVHNKGRDGSLRSAASKMNIPAITVEVGDPQRFQHSMIRDSIVGIYNILSYLDMFPMEVMAHTHQPVICHKSFWIYTENGGILEVYPELTSRVKKGDRIGKLVDIFGGTIKEYFAPADGIVVGKATNPISQTGSRIIHLGVEN